MMNITFILSSFAQKNYKLLFSFLFVASNKKKISNFIHLFKKKKPRFCHKKEKIRMKYIL